MNSKSQRVKQRQKGRIYTIGFNYKCGNCGQVCRHYKNKCGMENWKRLHFKINEDCKAHHKKFGLGDGFNNSFTDTCGKTHLVGSARSDAKMDDYYKMPKGHGHNKHHLKEELELLCDQEAYLMKARTDDNYKLQLTKDGLNFRDDVHKPIGLEEDALTQRDIAFPQDYKKFMKAQKKRKKRLAQKNRKKISKSLTPHHF
tara:strand:- start:99 stop:698 length:600 start_codon:yes stop_codon:yes gene_type:complete